ncbi:MAG: glycosyltransferase [Acidobacteriia bacterium]|nr:glycosyltransferase [Terriglobia bacterium]
MKIVQFVNNLDMGGIERLAVELGCRQKAEGHEPIIYCLTHRGDFAKEAEASGIRVVAFQKDPGPSPGTVWAMVKRLRKDRPDILHTHNHLVHHYGVLAGRLAGVPAIVNTRHGALVRIKEQGSRFVATTSSPDVKADLIYRACLRWTDAVVLISEATRKFFIEHRGCPSIKTHVILNGAPLEPFLSRPASPGSLRPRIRFGTASRMVADKDHFTLLKAFAKAAESLPHAELHVAGDGPLRSRIELLIAELNLNQKVVLHGAVRDVPRFLNQLDIFVMTSVNEGLPVAVLEAMAAGLPIVSTRVGGIQEAAIEGLNARFAKHGDAMGLAHEMTQMALCRDLASIGAQGRRLVSERFQIERTWKEYETLFQRIRIGLRSPN